MLKASGCNKVISIKTTNKRSILKAGFMTEKKMCLGSKFGGL